MGDGVGQAVGHVLVGVVHLLVAVGKGIVHVTAHVV
jgi:hypothetical protein